MPDVVESPGLNVDFVVRQGVTWFGQNLEFKFEARNLLGTDFEEFQQRRVPRLSPFEVRPWNMKEFYIHDPHGNLLKFGCGEW